MSEEAKAMTDHSTDRLTDRIKNTIKKRSETPPFAEFIGNDSLPVSRENTLDLPGGAALCDWLSRRRLGRPSVQLSERKLAILASQKAPKSILGRAQKKRSYASGAISAHYL